MAQVMYFFRLQEDATTLYFFSLQHFLVMLIYLCGLFWFVYFARRWRGRWTRRLANPLIWLVAITFIIQHIWLLVRGSWHAVLPFDWHRLAQVLLLLSFYTYMPLIRKFAALVGIFAASAVILLPLPNAYAWPHVSFVTEIIGSLALGWLSLLVILIDRKPWTLIDLLGGLGVIFMNSIWLTIFNIWQNSNYAFLREPPFWQEAFLFFGEGVYIAGVIITYMLCFALTFLAAYQLQKRLQ